MTRNNYLQRYSADISVSQHKTKWGIYMDWANRIRLARMIRLANSQGN